MGSAYYWVSYSNGNKVMMLLGDKIGPGMTFRERGKKLKVLRKATVEEINVYWIRGH